MTNRDTRQDASGRDDRTTLEIRRELADAERRGDLTAAARLRARLARRIMDPRTAGPRRGR